MMLAVVSLIGFGALAFFAAQFGRVDGGWGSEGFLAGLARVVFSFSIGVGMCRLYKAGKLNLPKIPYICIVAVLVLILFLPITRGGLALVTDLFAIAVVFPMLIAFAVNTEAPRILLPMATFLGAASYPLYIIHPPILRAVLPPIDGAGLAPAMELAVVLAVVVAVIGLAWAVDRWFDRPVRALIKSTVRRSPQPS
jgi:peptidoglycan/LPS O-acetylase OafA/YrhL